MRKPLLNASHKKRRKRSRSTVGVTGRPKGAETHFDLMHSPGGKRRNRKVPDLPPHEQLEKHPDEAYGDTEIPERKEEI